MAGAPGTLEIRLLGEQLVAAGGGPRRSPPSRAIALLAYLVLHAGAAQPRARLAGLFWPDSTEAQARTNLRRELHELRAVLGDCHSLVVEPLTLTWRDSPGCRVDVRTFDEARTAAVSARAGGDEEAFLRHADEAIAEYRGELLPGVYDDWVLEEREGLLRQCVELCDLAAEGWRRVGDHARAVEIARRRLQLEPLEEAGYRLLMRVQADSGDRAAAMTTYHRCASVLEQELGVSPDLETARELERLLQRGGVAVERRARVTARTDAPGASLVGRRGEVELLVRRWQDAVSGRGGLMVVSGEAGVGKSRLLAELASRAAAEGAAVAVTRCFALSGLPLAPASDWLRSRDLRAGVEALEPVWRREVERLVPATATEPGGRGRRAAGSATPPRQPSAMSASRAMVDAWQRHRFFEALARAALSAGRPTLLMLDDLQWCDQETMAWMAFLMSFAKDAPLLIAATLRSQELESNRDVAVGLRGLESAGFLTELGLGPLSADESGELVAGLLGRPLGESERHFLHAVTAGNPFLLLEAAHAFPDSAQRDHPLDRADVQTVLRHRLAQPTAAAREVAGLAAALGTDFSLDILSEASDLDADTLVEAVDELWRLRILREQRGGYDFSHDLLREAAYAAVSPARRWLLHRRLAQGLEILHAGHLDDVAAPLAEQYDRGGRADRALQYFMRAAQAAAGVFANSQAVAYYRRCLELVEQMPSGRERDRVELEVLWQMSAPLNAVRGYSSPEVQTTLERAATLSERLGQRHLLLTTLVGLFANRFVSGQTATAYEIGVRALALAEEGAPPELLGQAHFAFAGGALTLGMPTTAISHFDLAHDLSRDAMSFVLGTRIEVHGRAWAAHAQWLHGNDARAAAFSEEAVRRAKEVDHPYSLAVALGYAAVTQQLRGDQAALGAAVAELRELCNRYQFAYYGEWGVILEGWMSGGGDGIARIQQGIGQLRSQGAFARMPYWLSLLADALIRHGQRRSGTGGGRQCLGDRRGARRALVVARGDAAARRS